MGCCESTGEKKWENSGKTSKSSEYEGHHAIFSVISSKIDISKGSGIFPWGFWVFLDFLIHFKQSLLPLSTDGNEVGLYGAHTQCEGTQQAIQDTG